MSIREEFDKWSDRTPSMRFYTAFNDGYLMGLEAAAKVCEDLHDWTDTARLGVMKDCAKAIRELKETK